MHTGMYTKADLYNCTTCRDNAEIQYIEIKQSGGGFGFTIRGGAEYNSSLHVLKIADGGAAQIDGRLRVSH